MPLLAKHFDVVAPDLPGHGFTRAKGRPTFRFPAWRARSPRSSKGWNSTRQWWSAIRRGRQFSRASASTGRSRRRSRQPQRRLSPVRGAAALPVSHDRQAVVSQSAGAAGVRLGRRSRGGRDPAQGTGRRSTAAASIFTLACSAIPAHVAGAIGMMANWDLSRMSRELAEARPKVLFIVGENDKAVSPATPRARRGHPRRKRRRDDPSRGPPRARGEARRRSAT